MELLTFLGTANAVSDAHHENSHLLIQSGSTNLLVDCPGNPVSRLQQTGFAPVKITHIVLTHFHPDHVSGLPLLLMDLWLMGRRDPLPIYGLSETIGQAKKMMELFAWNKWNGLYPVEFIDVTEQEQAVIIDDQNLVVRSSPVKHLIPTIGLCFEFPISGKKIVYSSDTEPCLAVANLAMHADILIHESAGAGTGHSSADQCGQMAQRCEVEELYLIHYQTDCPQEALVSDAKQNYSGQVYLAEDFNKILLA